MNSSRGDATEFHRHRTGKVASLYGHGSTALLWTLRRGDLGDRRWSDEAELVVRAHRADSRVLDRHYEVDRSRPASRQHASA